MKIFQLKHLILTLLCLGVKGNAQFRTTIPLNEEVASGTLKNGMKYYVLHNEWPKDRVSFYFAQNVGAILENDDQNGLAHFLEHMAFNGTKNFEDKGIVDMLEKKGVRFGADINAYTAQDQTVYNLSNVPSKDNELLDSCLLILHDWSGFLSLNDDEIDGERGVVREEWRTRRNANFRLMLQTNKSLYNNSKYAKRDVIGDLNIINNFDYKVLRDYYKKWYRPDLQSVIVVGDVDVKKMEQKIINLFSTIVMPQNPAERYYIDIPNNKTMDYVLAKDKEAQETNICLYYKINKEKLITDASIKGDLINSLGMNMLNRRYQEFTENGKTSAIGFGVGTSEISRLKDAFYLYVVPKNGKVKESFKELMVEMERAYRYGFTQKELDRNKLGVLSYYENAIQDKDRISNDNLSKELVNYFLKATPFESIEKQFDDVQTRLASITLSDVNAAVKKWQAANNMLLTVTGPDKEELIYPSKTDYITIMKEVKKKDLEAYREVHTDQPLIKEELKGATVSKESPIEGVPNAKSYILSNGAKVIVYPTNLANDEILFSAFSKGGTSLIQTQDIPSAQMAVSLAENSGLGTFKNMDLQDKLNGKIVDMKSYISELTEGFKGASNQKDMETMLQLLYLNFEHPRFDKDSYSRMITEYRNSLENSLQTNPKVFQDTISQLSSNRNKRIPLFNELFINQLNFEKAQSIYKERIQNAADFTFFFVGNLPENALSLIQKYIGSISSDVNKKENFIDNHIEPATAVSKQLLVREMDVPKASVYIKFLQASPYNYKDGFTLYILSKILSKKYRDIIREEEGGSYGVNVVTGNNRLPENDYSMTINFDSDPEKEEKLTKVIYDQIDLIQKELANADEMESIKKTVLKIREEKIATNGFWLSNLNNMILYSEAFKNDEAYKKSVEEVTADDIRKFAKFFFTNPKTIEVIMKSKIQNSSK